MLRYLVLFGLLGFGYGLFAQEQLLVLEAEAEFENIKVRKLSSSPEASAFVIWVKDTVKKHYHAEHTENLYILEGEGVFYLGDKVYNIKAGDYFKIPKKSIHSVKVKSKIPLKALSVQSPEFLGKDRIFVD